MIINVIPQRIMRTAEELKESKKALIYAGYSIEEVIDSLRRSEDQSLQIVAAKLNKNLDQLRIKIKIIDAVIIALDRVAAIYARTESNAVSYEDETNISAFMKYKTVDINKVRIKATNMFDVF